MSRTTHVSEASRGQRGGRGAGHDDKLASQTAHACCAHRRSVNSIRRTRVQGVMQVALQLTALLCLRGQELPEGKLGYVEFNPFHPAIHSQDIYPSDRPHLVGAADGQDALKCFILNTAAERMEPQGFSGSAPKEWTSFGFHTQPTMETQVLLAPSASWYRPLARLPQTDGCAYQANFGAGTNSGCNITGVPAEPIPAGGFRFPDPYSNKSHCQLFSSCISKEVWESDARHLGDLGAQGQWCSEVGGCWRPGAWRCLHYVSVSAWMRQDPCPCCHRTY